MEGDKARRQRADDGRQFGMARHHMVDIQQDADLRGGEGFDQGEELLLLVADARPWQPLDGQAHAVTAGDRQQFLEGAERLAEPHPACRGIDRLGAGMDRELRCAQRRALVDHLDLACDDRVAHGVVGDREVPGAPERQMDAADADDARVDEPEVVAQPARIRTFRLPVGRQHFEIPDSAVRGRVLPQGCDEFIRQAAAQRGNGKRVGRHHRLPVSP